MSLHESKINLHYEILEMVAGTDVVDRVTQ